MKNLITFIFILIVIVLFVSCKASGGKEENVSFICVRDTNALHFKINNNTGETIYVPCYDPYSNDGGDTIFVVAKDKQEYFINSFYLYRNVFPFELYTAKKIEGENPDTVITIIEPRPSYNAFCVRPFISVDPYSSNCQSMTYFVPEEPSIACAVYYKQSFKSWLGEDKEWYLEGDFRRFDSLNANYVSSKILDRFYVHY